MKTLVTKAYIKAWLAAREDRGATAVEYGLIIALVAVVVIIGLTALGGKANSLFSGLSDKLTLGS